MAPAAGNAAFTANPLAPAGLKQAWPLVPAPSCGAHLFTMKELRTGRQTRTQVKVNTGDIRMIFKKNLFVKNTSLKIP